MNPVLQDVLGSFFRWLLMLWVPFFVKVGILSETQAATFVAFLVSALVAIAWSVWQKYGHNILLNTALASSHKQSLDDLKAKVSEGKSAPALTPANVVPVIAKPES